MEKVLIHPLELKEGMNVRIFVRNEYNDVIGYKCEVTCVGLLGLHVLIDGMPMRYIREESYIPYDDIELIEG